MAFRNLRHCCGETPGVAQNFMIRSPIPLMHRAQIVASYDARPSLSNAYIIAAIGMNRAAAPPPTCTIGGIVIRPSGSTHASGDDLSYSYRLTSAKGILCRARFSAYPDRSRELKTPRAGWKILLRLFTKLLSTSSGKPWCAIVHPNALAARIDQSGLINVMSP